MNTSERSDLINQIIDNNLRKTTELQAQDNDGLQ